MPSLRRFRAVFVVIAACAAMSSRPASAQPAPGVEPGASAQAEVLFRDAKQKMAEGSTHEACALFAESHRLDPASGTLLALAQCHEAEGLFATAWADFQAAAALARTDGRSDREAIAREHADALAPRLARLRVVVAPSMRSAAGFRVRRDGVALGPDVYGMALVVDPGEHVVEASADGRASVRRTVRTEAGADVTTVELGELAPLPGKARPPPPPTPRRAAEPDVQRIVGFASLGVGALATGLGTYFALHALSLQSSAEDACRGVNPCADPAATAESRSAGHQADVATGLFIGAGVATAVGVVLLVVNPRAARTVARASLSRSPRDPAP